MWDGPSLKQANPLTGRWFENSNSQGPQLKSKLYMMWETDRSGTKVGANSIQFSAISRRRLLTRPYEPGPRRKASL